MTINEHIYAIKYLANGGEMTDDFPYPDAFIEHLLKVARAAIIEQKLSKYHPISDTNYQTIKMKLTSLDPMSCTTDNCLRITEEEVPTSVTSRRGSSIIVTDADGVVIAQTSLLRYKKSKLLKEEDKTIKWYFLNGKIVVVNNHTLQYIFVKGIFDKHPNFCNDSGDACTTEFAIDTDLTDQMYKYVLNYLVNAQNIGKDTSNDANFNKSKM